MLHEIAQVRDAQEPVLRPLDYAVSDATITLGNRVTLLVGGQETYPAMLAAIAGARRRVLLESYIIAPDETGRRFIDALVAAGVRGCDVRLIYDAVGSWSLPPGWIEALELAGGHVLAYRPVAPWRRRWGLWRRDHRKVLVVDDQVGFVGGINLADEYDARTPAGRSWRDLHLRVEGPAVTQLVQLVVRTWNREVPRPERVRWQRPEVTPLADGVPMAVVGNRETRHRLLIRRSFVYAVAQARRSVILANPYFLPDWQVVRALRAAARRGVDVRIVVPAASDVPLVDLAARHTFSRLLKAGIRIAEWPGMMHAKAAAVDGTWATVGSYNLDRRSLRFNLEVTANVFDPTFAATVEARLREDFQAARELRQRELKARSVWERLGSMLAYRLRAWL
ncbi:MAG TPA: phospholipase D-like domain-containing protein [Polyangia bacterium]|jgi:cardiolipin synthase|nr:phospholipase D-like domain-containing protein [Polyangia bacterium]